MDENEITIKPELRNTCYFICNREGIMPDIFEKLKMCKRITGAKRIEEENAEGYRSI